MVDPHLIDSHKLHLHPGRVAQWMSARTIEEKLAVYPIYVEISPVGHCNHRCTFCAVDYIGYKARSLDIDMLAPQLFEMGRLGVKSVMFAGEGEPLLHKEIDQLVRATNEAGIDVAFTTNGVLLEKIIPVLDKITWIKVSMNGGEKSYEKVHRAKAGDYEKVWASLESAAAKRKEGNISTAIGIQCVVLPENIEDLGGLCKKALETGLDYVVLKPYSQHKSSITQKYAFLSYDEQLQQLRSLREEYSTAVFKVIVREAAMNEWDKGEHSYDKCNATPYFWGYIMATGDVYGCSAYLLDNRFNYGNINSSTFKEVWNSKKRADSIGFVEGSLDIAQCRLNCRMNQANKYLAQVSRPDRHVNFI